MPQKTPILPARVVEVLPEVEWEKVWHEPLTLIQVRTGQTLIIFMPGWKTIAGCEYALELLAFCPEIELLKVPQYGVESWADFVRRRRVVFEDGKAYIISPIAIHNPGMSGKIVEFSRHEMILDVGCGTIAATLDTLDSGTRLREGDFVRIVDFRLDLLSEPGLLGGTPG